MLIKIPCLLRVNYEATHTHRTSRKRERATFQLNDGFKATPMPLCGKFANKSYSRWFFLFYYIHTQPSMGFIYPRNCNFHVATDRQKGHCGILGIASLLTAGWKETSRQVDTSYSKVSLIWLTVFYIHLNIPLHVPLTGYANTHRQRKVLKICQQFLGKMQLTKCTLSYIIH